MNHLHGKAASCPTCESEGYLDLTSSDELDPQVWDRANAEGEQVIWHEPQTKKWQCTHCFNKAVEDIKFILKIPLEATDNRGWGMTVANNEPSEDENK